MRKTIQIDVMICDAPGCEEHTHEHYACHRCGTAYCYKHQKELAVTYGGSRYSNDDFYYCKPCDEKLNRERIDPLHAALQRVAALKAEWKAFNDDWEMCIGLAGNEVRRLVGAGE